MSSRRTAPLSILLSTAFVLASGCAPTSAPATADYADLLTLFDEWREFEKPAFIEGVPDYTPTSMARQHRELIDYQARLGAMDISGWSVSQKIDYNLVRAEMNGLDFDHRIRKPWEQNPAFYTMIFSARSDVPAHEGPVIHGWIDVWTYDFPLSSSAAAELATRIRAIPPLLQQARTNLTGNARDLWNMGIRAMESQARDLTGLEERVSGNTELVAAIGDARDATTSFAAWLREHADSKTGPSGVGAENYTWYLQNVKLLPYTWEEELTLMKRELWRSHSSLRLEEHRNRALPQLSRIASAEEYDRRLNEAVDDYLAFLRDDSIVTMRDYMDPALRAQNGTFEPVSENGLRGFFSEVSYRDPVTMRTHSHHWIELARMELDPHESAIRRVPPLSNIYDSRSEGLATGMEEMMMHAGLFDSNPRARELIYILLAQRAARSIAGLMMHGNEYTIDEAVQFASEWTPRGWLPADGNTVWGEQHLYLQQPGYGTSYLIGKIQIEKLMAERANQLGSEFSIKRFMDEFEASGVIPISLIRWEMTGQDGDVPVGQN